MLVVTAVLAMPATNTGLLLVDPYMTARSFSTPLTLFALAGLLERRYVQRGSRHSGHRGIPSPDGRLPHLPGLCDLGGETQQIGGPRTRTGNGLGGGDAAHRLLSQPRQRPVPRSALFPRLFLSLQLDLVSLGRHAGSAGDPGLVLEKQAARDTAGVRVSELRDAAVRASVHRGGPVPFQFAIARYVRAPAASADVSSDYAGSGASAQRCHWRVPGQGSALGYGGAGAASRDWACST